MAALPVPTLSVDDDPAIMEPGLSEALAPGGRPLTERLTLCVEPEVTVVEMVLVPEVPCTRLRLEGLAEMEKSFGGGAVIVSDSVVAWVLLVPVPVTVRL